MSAVRICGLIRVQYAILTHTHPYKGNKYFVHATCKYVCKWACACRREGSCAPAYVLIVFIKFIHHSHLLFTQPNEYNKNLRLYFLKQTN